MTKILDLDKRSIQISIAASISIIGVIWAASAFVSRAEATDIQVKDLSNKVNELNRVNTDILVRLERIDTNVSNTQIDVTDIKHQLKQ